MKILYITHCDPRKTDFGSAQRSHLLWKALQRMGDVYTVYNVGIGVPLVRDEDARIASWCLVPKSWFLRHFQGLLARFFSPAIWQFQTEKKIKGLLPWKDVKFDCVVVRYLMNVAYAKAWAFGPVYVDIDDLPLEAYRTVYEKTNLWPISIMGRSVVGCWQRSMLERCRGSWIANPTQTSFVETVVPCVGLPNLAIPPSAGYRINGAQKKQLMTVGLMSYPPNYEGVDWFVKYVWPLVRVKCPDLTYVVCGGGVSQELRAKWSTIPGVEVRGFVKDLDAVYEESLAVVAPILSGAGTCIKVMEGALRGRKVFATEFALRGYDRETLASLRISEIKSSTDMLRSIRSILLSSIFEIQVKIAEEAEKMNSFDCFCEQVRILLKEVLR